MEKYNTTNNISKDTLLIDGKYRVDKEDVDKIFGGVVGLVIGDALGVPFEFKEPSSFSIDDVERVSGYGTHNQPPGTWSDDTSLSIALMDSIIKAEGDIDLNVIARVFVDWYYLGKYTVDDIAFDIGTTTIIALNKLNDVILNRGDVEDLINVNKKKYINDDPYKNGNGGLMRIFPIAVYIYLKRKYGNEDISFKDQVKIVDKVVGLTHGHKISRFCCNFYVDMIINILNGLNPDDAYNLSRERFTLCCSEVMPIYDEEKIYKGNINIERSPGYVVTTLEIALHSFLTTSSFKDAVLKSISFGYDTDTYGTVTGALAGVYYGISNIPYKWKSGKIRKLDMITNLTNKFIEACVSANSK